MHGVQGEGEGREEALQEVRSSLAVITMAARKQPQLVAERMELLLKVLPSAFRTLSHKLQCLKLHLVWAILLFASAYLLRVVELDVFTVASFLLTARQSH